MSRHSVLPRGGSAIAPVLLLLPILSIAPGARPATAALDASLSPLAPYVGRVFSAEMAVPDAPKPAIDVQRWEEILGGKAVRITHSINGGDYGGDSLVTREHVVGEAGGVTEVEAVWHLTADGYAVTSRYLGAGQWSPGRTASYRETPDAEPRFR